MDGTTTQKDGTVVTATAAPQVVPLSDTQLRQHTLLQQHVTNLPDDQRSVDSSTGAAYHVPMHHHPGGASRPSSTPSVFSGRLSVISDVKADIYDCDEEEDDDDDHDDRNGPEGGKAGRTNEEPQGSPTTASSSPLRKTNTANGAGSSATTGTTTTTTTNTTTKKVLRWNRNTTRKHKKQSPQEMSNAVDNETKETFWTNRTNRRIVLFLTLLFIVVTVAIVVVVWWTKPSSGSDTSVPSHNSGDPTTTDHNGTATNPPGGGNPAAAPSPGAPLYSDDAVQYIHQVLRDITARSYSNSNSNSSSGSVDDTVAAIWEDPTSSQVRARDWIIYQDTFLLSQEQQLQQQSNNNDDRTTTSVTGWMDRLLQRYALVQLYYATEGPYWMANYTRTSSAPSTTPNASTGVDFANPTTSECTWTGVTCDDTKRRRYLKLLPRQKYTWEPSTTNGRRVPPEPHPMGEALPPYHHHHHHHHVSSVSSLPQHRLAAAILSHEFGDEDPLQMSRLLQDDTTNYYGTDGAMNKVFRLYFQRTNLSGTIPNELGRCIPKLYELDLSQNQLDGTIPFSLFAPDSLWDTSLYWLDMSGNRLKGSIPSNIWTLHELRFLFLNQNKLTGRLERYWNESTTAPTNSTNNETISGGKRSNLLKQIQLFDNRLSGSIPDWFQELSDLEQFVVFENQLTGPLPDPIPASLIVFDVSFNQINGTIPIKFWSESDSPTHIERLYLDHNQLSGTIPNSTQLRQDMQRLWLNDNFQLTGTIPENFGRAWSRLSELQLHHTNVTGQLGPENSTATSENGPPVDNCRLVWPNLTVMKANCLQRVAADEPPVYCECCTLCESVNARKRQRQRTR